VAECQSRFLHPRKLNQPKRTVTTRRLRYGSAAIKFTNYFDLLEPRKLTTELITPLVHTHAPRLHSAALIHRLLNHARIDPQANLTGACVVLLLVPSALATANASPHKHSWLPRSPTQNFNTTTTATENYVAMAVPTRGEII
jgi:hypothetical protein